MHLVFSAVSPARDHSRPAATVLLHTAVVHLRLSRIHLFRAPQQVHGIQRQQTSSSGNERHPARDLCRRGDVRRISSKPNFLSGESSTEEIPP